jgi:hypothetical protein
LVWANAPEPTSATKTPKRQSTEAIKTRRLKNADFEVDFFFMVEAELFSLCGEPETITNIIPEMLNQCQAIFPTGYPLLDTGGGGLLRMMRSINDAATCA